jgi:hypothetical protein
VLHGAWMASYLVGCGQSSRGTVYMMMGREIPQAGIYYMHGACTIASSCLIIDLGTSISVCVVQYSLRFFLFVAG